MKYYISHHGVEGQKWGVRNAEWYPIADWEAHLKNEDKGETKKLTRYQKKHRKRC